MKPPRLALGQRSEHLARRFLEAQGWSTYARNYRTPWGEIDLVMWDGAVLVLVEVRARRSRAFGSPEESLTHRKRMHLLRSAQQVVHDLGFSGDWRVDLVTVSWEKGTPPILTHFPAILEGDASMPR
ncbi:MAG: YraN family protein [Dehalococcoidia bacterium]|nr:YraN family protein [Dehalococcoidia bacterium]MDW8119533.1 YraN family protein [Chloroflexota bacterium]